MSRTARWVHPKVLGNVKVMERFNVRSEAHHARDRRPMSSGRNHRFINGHGIVRNSRYNLARKNEKLADQEQRELA